MADKDFNERAIIKELFPSAAVLICLFHSLQLLLLLIIIITFILIQEIGFTESLLSWKTLTGSNSAQLPFLYSLHRIWKRLMST